MQPLLAVPWQGITTTQVQYSKRATQHVVDRCEHFRVRVHTVEGLIFIGQVPQVSSAALLNIGRLPSFTQGALERHP